MTSTYKRHLSIVKLILRKGASVLSVNERGADALAIARNQNNPSLVAILEDAYKKETSGAQGTKGNRIAKEAKVSGLLKVSAL